MPSFFVPARDSRHRVACFALYRALLRQVPHISLPADLTSRPGWINPIRFLIRAGFRRNKGDTSPRLVTSALQSGYRFLTLLTRAHDASAPQHSEIVAFLRERQGNFPPPRSTTAPDAEEDENKKGRAAAAAVPLLTRVSAPGEKPVYKATARPLPLAQLSGGVRKVPVMDQTSSGHSFLRVGKPESRVLGSFLQRKSMARQRRITLVQELQDEYMTQARDEDRWEEELARLAGAEGVSRPEGSGTDDGGRDGTYAEPVLLGVRHVGEGLNREVEDMFARARALVDIVEEEKKLAEAEARDRKRLKKRERATRKREEREEAERAERAERRRRRQEARGQEAPEQVTVT